jgi:hypothetical protein
LKCYFITKSCYRQFKSSNFQIIQILDSIIDFNALYVSKYVTPFISFHLKPNYCISSFSNHFSDKFVHILHTCYVKTLFNLTNQFLAETLTASIDKMTYLLRFNRFLIFFKYVIKSLGNNDFILAA